MNRRGFFGFLSVAPVAAFAARELAAAPAEAPKPPTPARSTGGPACHPDGFWCIVYPGTRHTIYERGQAYTISDRVAGCSVCGSTGMTPLISPEF